MWSTYDNIAYLDFPNSSSDTDYIAYHRTLFYKCIVRRTVRNICKVGTRSIVLLADVR